MTVNHDVAGSSPARGAKESLENAMFSRLFLLLGAIFLTNFFAEKFVSILDIVSCSMFNYLSNPQFMRMIMTAFSSLQNRG